MKRIFWHLGNKHQDYLSIVEAGNPFYLQERLIHPRHCVLAEQVHKDKLHFCQPLDSGSGFFGNPLVAGADALISDITGQYLIIRTADCLPILLFDPQKMVVAAVHSGRAGTRTNIVGKCIQAMVEHYSCNPQDIVAHVGAGICEEHYQVSSELYQDFNSALEAQGFCPCTNKEGHLNLRTTIFQQLIQSKLRFYNIENYHICTYEQPDFFSYRRDRTANRQINVIGIIDE